VGRTGPLAVHDPVVIIRVPDVGWLHSRQYYRASRAKCLKSKSLLSYWQAFAVCDEQMLISTLELSAAMVQVALRACTAVIWPPSPRVPALRCLLSTYVMTA